MSHFTEIKTQLLVAHEDCLIAALESMRFNPVVFDEAVQLTGYQGDARSQLAHIVIPGRNSQHGEQQISGWSNDSGFLRLEDGTYQVFISEYDQMNYWVDGRRMVGGRFLVELKLRYSDLVVQKIAAELKCDPANIERIETDDKIIYRIKANLQTRKTRERVSKNTEIRTSGQRKIRTRG